jgi:hypothetical protein
MAFGNWNAQHNVEAHGPFLQLLLIILGPLALHRRTDQRPCELQLATSRARATLTPLTPDIALSTNDVERDREWYFQIENEQKNPGWTTAPSHRPHRPILFLPIWLPFAPKKKKILSVYSS